jgi:excisionase family DNA binding protein
MTATEYTRDSLLTSHQVSSLLQVNPSSVNKWVEEGRIRAFRTPGGHRRIKVADLLSFLNTHNIPVPGPLAAVTRRRLLVVDDDTRQLKGLSRLLKAYEDEVDVSLTTNGIDALVRVGSFKPHLVVLDVYMSELDGVEVCRRLKANPETSEIDVVIATGKMTDELEKAALEAGALRCIAKPIDLDVVLADMGVELEQPAARPRRRAAR